MSPPVRGHVSAELQKGPRRDDTGAHGAVARPVVRTGSVPAHVVADRLSGRLWGGIGVGIVILRWLLN